MSNADDKALSEEEDECPECEECGPPGLPAWMGTFADMMALLMCFFVLILSFAEMNVPKFKQISGSMKDAFGIQRLVPVVEQPKGTIIIEMNFSPSVTSPSLMNIVQQQDADEEQPELEPQQHNKEEDFTSQAEADAEAMKDSLKDEIARGMVEVKTLGDKVVVQFTAIESDNKNQPVLQEETLDAMAKVAEVASKIESKVRVEKTEDTKPKNPKPTEGSETSTAEEDTDGKVEAPESEAELKAVQDVRELTVALKQQIDAGLVSVEQRGDSVIVTVGAGGAFPSGTSELTGSARKIIDKIGDVAGDSAGEIVVAGHTDNVPLAFTDQFKDNWDLAAGRANSVVRELEKNQDIEGSKLKSISYGQSRPVASNKTSENREKNRRIEIELKYPKGSTQ